MGWLSDGERAKAAAYLRVLADSFGLRDWRFEIADDPAPPKKLAMVQPMLEQSFAWVLLSERWADLAPERQRQTLVHELLHCHLQGCRAAIWILDGKMDKSAFEIAKAWFDWAEEITVDQLTAVNGSAPAATTWLGWLTGPALTGLSARASREAPRAPNGVRAGYLPRQPSHPCRRYRCRPIDTAQVCRYSPDGRRGGGSALQGSLGARGRPR